MKPKHGKSSILTTIHSEKRDITKKANEIQPLKLQQKIPSKAFLPHQKKTNTQESPIKIFFGNLYLNKIGVFYYQRGKPLGIISTRHFINFTTIPRALFPMELQQIWKLGMNKDEFKKHTIFFS